MVPRVGPSTLILAGATLGLAAMFFNWTGDGRGIDYIQPSQRFQAGYKLPLPLTLLAMGAIVGVGVTFLSGASNLINLRWGRSVVHWLGGIAGLVMATFPILAHFGYEFWRYYNEYGVSVFRSGDWGAGLWLALAGGILALTGVVLSVIVGRRPQIGRYSILALMVLLGAVLASCSQVQSFQTPPASGPGWRAIGPEGIDVTSLAISPKFSEDGTIFIGLGGWDLGVFRSTNGGDKWEEVFEGLRGTVAPWVVVSPAFASDGTIFAGRGNGGVYRSTDGGDSWKKASRGFPRYEDIGECCGYYLVLDLVFSPSFASDNTLYLGTLDGLFRSIDRGDTWQKLSLGLKDTWITEVAISPSFASDNTLLVVARNKSWDTGPSLFRSTDRGNTWRQVTQNLGVGWDRWITTRLVLSPSYADDGTLYAATLDGLLRSTDRGDTWQKVYSYDEILEGNFEPWVVVSPDFASDDTVFTSKVCGGVFSSNDRGDTWREVTQELTVPTVALSSVHQTCEPPGFNSLVFSPSFASDNTVFVWTEVGIIQLFEFSPGASPEQVARVKERRGEPE